MILSDADKEGLTPEEIRALEQSEEGEGEGLLKVDGQAVGATEAENNLEQDDKAKTGEQGQQAAAPAAAPAPAAQEGQQANEEGEDDGNADAAAAITAPPPAPKEFKVEERDFGAELKAVRSERAEVEKQWTDGDLTDEQRLQKLEELEERRDSLLIEQTRAQTLADINRQNTAQQQEQIKAEEDLHIVALIKKDAAEGEKGVGYISDKSVQEDFDAALAAVKASASHAGKSPAEIVRVAHNMVLAMRGIAPTPSSAPAPAPEPAPAPQAKNQRREVPPSLGGLPDAGRSAGSVSDENWSRFSQLNGEAAERFLAGLSESEVERLTRMADSKMFSR